MAGRGLTSLALMALILSLDARSLYRKKRWSSPSDIRDALEELSRKRTYPYYPARDMGPYQEPNPYNGRDPYENLFSEDATQADMDELKDILSPDDISASDMADMLESGREATVEPVSKSELEDIFNDNEDVEKRKHGGGMMGYFKDGDKVDKKKRQTEQEPDIDEFLVTENELLQKENEYLAGALNAATLGQMEHSNRYIKDQYDYLKKAVKAEEALHELNAIPESDEEADEDEDDEKAKKSSEVLEVNPDEEEEERKKKLVPVKKQDHEYAQINPLLRKLVDEYSQEQLQRRAQQLAGEQLQRRAQQLEDTDADEEDRRKKQDELPMEAPGIDMVPAVLAAPEEEDEVEEPDESAGGDDNLVENLQTMVANLTPRQRHLMEDEVKTLLETGLLESECPAVESVADDCERLMRIFSVELDQQAKDVCNRHKVCYSCGSSIDPQKTLNRNACDKIFIDQANALCGRDQQCQRSASGLFTLMKQEHGYIDWPSPVTAQLCSQKCVLDFLLNGE